MLNQAAYCVEHAGPPVSHETSVVVNIPQHARLDLNLKAALKPNYCKNAHSVSGQTGFDVARALLQMGIVQEHKGHSQLH